MCLLVIAPNFRFHIYIHKHSKDGSQIQKTSCAQGLGACGRAPPAYGRIFTSPPSTNFRPPFGIGRFGLYRGSFRSSGSGLISVTFVESFRRHRGYFLLILKEFFHFQKSSMHPLSLKKNCFYLFKSIVSICHFQYLI